MPIDRRQGGTARTGSPAMKMSPAVGVWNPAIMRKSVVLPEPDGPRMVRKAPVARSKETSSTAFRPG